MMLMLPQAYACVVVNHVWRRLAQCLRLIPSAAARATHMDTDLHLHPTTITAITTTTTSITKKQTPANNNSKNTVQQIHSSQQLKCYMPTGYIKKQGNGKGAVLHLPSTVHAQHTESQSSCSVRFFPTTQCKPGTRAWAGIGETSRCTNHSLPPSFALGTNNCSAAHHPASHPHETCSHQVQHSATPTPHLQRGRAHTKLKATGQTRLPVVTC